jgi:hypothetical protein
VPTTQAPIPLTAALSRIGISRKALRRHLQRRGVEPVRVGGCKVIPGRTVEAIRAAHLAWEARGIDTGNGLPKQAAS